MTTGTPIGWDASDGGTAWAPTAWTTSLLSLANGASSVSPVVDNTVATLGEAAYDIGVLEINLGASTTLGSSLPVTLQAAILNSVDNTNFDAAFVSNSTLYPLETWSQASFPASASAQLLLVKILPLLPALFRVALLNTLGVPFPASGVSSTFYRYRGRAG